jgi:hypothetical protein
MEGPVTKAMIDVGIISRDALSELKRWGYMAQPIEPSGSFNSHEEVVMHIREAVESDDAVRTRDTDFTVLERYLATKSKAKLHVPSPEDPEKTVGITLDFGRTKLGEIIIPFLAETVMDTLLDDRTYLKPVGEDRIYFRDTRVLYYDDHPAFVICEGVPK